MRQVSLRLKFIAVILVILLLIFGLISVVLLRSSMRQQINDVNRESLAFASLATKPIGDSVQLYQSSGTIRINQEVNRFTALDSNISNVVVVDATGKPIYNHTGKSAPNISEAEATSFTASKKTDTNSGQITQVIQPYLSDNGTHPFNIVYQVSDAELAGSSRSAALQILLFSSLGLLASALAMYLLINRFFLRPIEKVSDLARAIAAGNYEQAIQLHSHDEIAQLADSVNHMANALKGNINQLREVDKLKDEFIMITSHNLRTPLTIIKGNISLLQGNQLNKDMSEMINSIEVSTRELNHFSEEMLLISEIEAGNQMSRNDIVNLDELLTPLQSEFAQRARTKNLGFELKISDQNARVQVNRHQIEIALHNLVDNALKFTDKGNIIINATTQEDGAVITVTDSGIGIKPAEIEKLFTKFHRGTDVLTYNYEGTGIGLYAAKMIIELHGGHISATSHEGQGSTFTVRLPLAQTQPNS